VLAGYLAGNATAPPPGQVSAPCCGEFSVAAARVTVRPRQLYADLLAWAAKPATLDGDRCLDLNRVLAKTLMCINEYMYMSRPASVGRQAGDAQRRQVCSVSVI
jgi:Protein of unknown function (DUF3431)